MSQPKVTAEQFIDFLIASPKQATWQIVRVAIRGLRACPVYRLLNPTTA